MNVRAHWAAGLGSEHHDLLDGAASRRFIPGHRVGSTGQTTVGGSSLGPRAQRNGAGRSAVALTPKGRPGGPAYTVQGPRARSNLESRLTTHQQCMLWLTTSPSTRGRQNLGCYAGKSRSANAFPALFHRYHRDPRARASPWLSMLARLMLIPVRTPPKNFEEKA